MDFEILQIEKQIEKCLVETVTMFNRNSYLLDLLKPVKDALIDTFMETEERLQSRTKKRMRLKNNRMCAEKCSQGSVIHNFTQFEVPAPLARLLEAGLNTVPKIVISDDKILAEVENELKVACRNLFTSIIGVFPYSISLKDSLDGVIKNLMILAPNNKHLNDSLMVMRENYHASLHAFTGSLIGSKENKDTIDVKKFLKMVPGKSILTPSDKNLGVCMVPHSWYEAQYREQLFKGGYELQDMDESSCLAMLF